MIEKEEDNGFELAALLGQWEDEQGILANYDSLIYKLLFTKIKYILFWT